MLVHQVAILVRVHCYIVAIIILVTGEGFAIFDIDNCDQSFELFDSHVKLIYDFEPKRAYIGSMRPYRGLNNVFTSISVMFHSCSHMYCVLFPFLIDGRIHCCCFFHGHSDQRWINFSSYDCES